MSRQFNEVMLGSIELFCLCAELSSFTQAAVKASVTPAAVSRSIGRLEQRLGVKLFIRTTRRIGLTDAGLHYFERCKQALGQLRDAESELAGQQLVPAGTVRISLPTPFGHYRVLPLLPKFHALYPDVQLEIHLSNHNIDFSAGRFDLAIRGRTPPDSGLVARHLETAMLVTVATPAYLARAGEPKSLTELARHNCIQFRLPSSGQPVPWVFMAGGKAIDLNTTGNTCFTEDILGGVTLARSGGGLLQTYQFIIQEDLDRGTLKEVLTEFSGCARPFSLLYPQNPHTPLRTRVLIDFLIRHLCVEA